MPLLEVAFSLSRLYQLLLSFDGAFVGIGVGLLALKSFSQSRFHFAAAEKIFRAPSVPLLNLRSHFPDGLDSELVVVSGRVRPKGGKGKGSSVLVSHLWDSKAVVVEANGRFHLSLRKVVFGLFKLMLWSIWTNQSMICPLLQFIIICSQFNHLFLHFCRLSLLINALLAFWMRREFPVDKMITAVGICSLQDGIPEIRPS